MPELNKALQAVEQIDKAGLQTLRTYQNPPPVVHVVMEGVCIFFGKKYDWKTAQQMLSNLNTFINEDILGYDKENISDKIMAKFNKFLETKYIILNTKNF
jgi:hypothetical protein